MRVRRGGDDDAVESGAEQRVGVVHLLDAQALGHLTGPAGVHVRDHERVDLSEGGERRGVEGADASGSGESDSHGQSSWSWRAADLVDGPECSRTGPRGSRPA